MRNILLVNDDGIDSEGLRALAEALAQKGRVYVCAPDTQQSGKSHSITLSTAFKIIETDYPGAELAWRVLGTPADCTKVGLQFCRERGIDIDIVYSGINKGSNLGTDTLYSGTVGAAMEASLAGIHAVAVSVNNHDASHFEAASKLAVDTMEQVLSDLPANVMLNINTPDLPPEEIKGVRVARLGPGYFDDHIVWKAGHSYMIVGEPPDYKHLGERIDIAANHMDYATLTTLRFDYTDEDGLKILDNWSVKI